MKNAFLILAITWSTLWLTPDQQAQREFRDGDYAEAAEGFTDPMWEGVAWYRAKEFEKAAQAFSRSASPEARFNEGNAWMILGKYETAIKCYDKALSQRPDWKDAQENREIAVIRAERRKSKGEDAGDQREGADKIVFDRNKPPGGQDTEVAGEKAVSDSTVQSMWLRRVQTKPSDFLRSKFAYQLAQDEEGDNK